MVTFAISEVCILLGDLNAIAPVITMFFMITYGYLCLATFYESVTGNPSYRPRFRFCHWTTSLAGAVGCLGVMFLIAEEQLEPFLSEGDYYNGILYTVAFLGEEILDNWDGPVKHAKEPWYPIPFIPLKWWQLLIVVLILAARHGGSAALSAVFTCCACLITQIVQRKRNET